ncbi:MAG TPA: aldo/keto reductase [Phycisphaerales bacterium]|nr:aldo/keto reductase [Phycisphaerales bacterium]
MVPRRPLGRTGITVSALGLGTVKLGRRAGVKYPHAFEIPDDATAARLLDTAHGLGINLLDTAPAYGIAEERLGKLLAGQRDRWVLGTKAGEEFSEATDESRFDFSAAAVTASIEGSLKRLGTDRLDIVLLHSDGRDTEIIERSGALDALAALKAAGKVRAIGISSKTREGAMLAIERCDVVMVAYSETERGDERAIAEAHRRGVGVLVKKSLASGHAPDPSAAIRFALANSGVSSVIVGTINESHLRSNASAAK